MSLRKLIEVALPLEAINIASAREKSIRHGHPSTLHLWWARRPLAACRAVLFASLVDDPSSHPDHFPTEESQLRERERLFGIIERLVKWENSNNEHVLREAREEILKHTNGNPPPVYDPFAGGGSIPLEAQRLGLEAHASDLNPVAVLINKALIEIPPKFANMSPVNPEDRNRSTAAWKGAAGLAADIRYYGKWMRDEAEKRIGYIYPKVKLPKEYGGGEATVIAWLWARTVKCPNPACGAHMPLMRSLWLSKGRGKEIWAEPVIDVSTRSVMFRVQKSKPTKKMNASLDNGTGFVNSQGKKVKSTFVCIVCGEGVVKGEYINDQANIAGLGVIPVGIVAELEKGRAYVDFDFDKIQESALNSAHDEIIKPAISEILPSEACRGTFASNAQGRSYGFHTFADYFTERQLIALATFAQILDDVALKVKYDFQVRGFDDEKAISYANAIVTYLAFAIDRAADAWSSLVSWTPQRDAFRSTFARQAISMVYDFAEANPFSSSGGNFDSVVDWICRCITELAIGKPGSVKQIDATMTNQPSNCLISTDPPYYGNVSYSELSDFFYVWLRRSLGGIYPEVFSTILTPKEPELVATPFQFGGDREKARKFFEDGSVLAFNRMRVLQNDSYPLTVYYAYKQSEAEIEDEDSVVVASTGWETMLEGLISARLTITGTWPMRTERDSRNVSIGTNALASSIVLVCRPRPEDARAATRREFLNALKAELPQALRRLQQGNIAPVDLAQAAIGPGMAVFSRYSKVVESDGSPMRVRAALQIINQQLDEVLAEQEGEFDVDTRWAIAWFDQYGVNEGPYGVAETLSKAKNTSVQGMVEAGVVVARSGKVRLLTREELPADWNPASDRRLTIWEVTQHLVHALDKRGEGGAASLLAKVSSEGDIARDLAYRLYTTCERKGWTQEALAYNSLVVAWPEITRQTVAQSRGEAVQGQMDL